jgi:hypothetical protein
VRLIPALENKRVVDRTADSRAAPSAHARTTSTAAQRLVIEGTCGELLYHLFGGAQRPIAAAVVFGASVAHFKPQRRQRVVEGDKDALQFAPGYALFLIRPLLLLLIFTLCRQRFVAIEPSHHTPPHQFDRNRAQSVRENALFGDFDLCSYGIGHEIAAQRPAPKIRDDHSAVLLFPVPPPCTRTNRSELDVGIGGNEAAAAEADALEDDRLLHRGVS